MCLQQFLLYNIFDAFSLFIENQDSLKKTIQSFAVVSSRIQGSPIVP